MLRFFVLISIVIGCPNACYRGGGCYGGSLPGGDSLNVEEHIDVNQLMEMNAAGLMRNKECLRKNWGTEDKPCYGINLAKEEELGELDRDVFDGSILSVIDPERVQYLNKDVLFREYEVDDESKPGTVKKEMGINIVPKDGLVNTVKEQFRGVYKKEIGGINSDRLGYLSGDVVGLIFKEVPDDRLKNFSTRQLKNIDKATLSERSDLLNKEAQMELFRGNKLDSDKLKNDVKRTGEEDKFYNAYSGVGNDSGIVKGTLMAENVLINDSLAFNNLLSRIGEEISGEATEEEKNKFIKSNISITVVEKILEQWSSKIHDKVFAGHPEMITYCDGGDKDIRYVDDEHKNKKLLPPDSSFFKDHVEVWKCIFRVFLEDDKYGDSFGRSVDGNIWLAAREEGVLDGSSFGSLPYKMLNNLTQTPQQLRALGNDIKYLPKRILKEKVRSIPSEYIPLLGGGFFACNGNKDEEFGTDLLSSNQIKHMTSAQIMNTTIGKGETTLCEKAVKNFTVDQLNGVKTCCGNSNTCSLMQGGCNDLVLGAIKEAGFFDKIASKEGAELKDKYDGNIIKNIKIEYLSKYFTDFAPGQLFHFTKDILKKDRCHSFKEDKMDENLFKIESLTEEQLKGLFNDHDGSQYDGSDKVDLYCNGANAWNGVSAWTNILVKDKDGNVTGRSITQVLFENNQLKLEHVKKKMNPSNFTELISQIGKNKDVFKKFFKSDLIGITDQDELKNMRLIDGVKQRKCCVYLEYLSEEQVKRINNQDFVSAILENYIEQQKFQTNADGKLVEIPCYANADLDALRKCNIAGNKMPDANKMYEYCFISDWIAKVKIDLLVKSFSSLIKECKSRNWKMSEDVDKCEKYGTLRTLLDDLVNRVDDIRDCYEKNKLNKDITDSIQTIYDEWLSDEYYDIGSTFSIIDESGNKKHINGLEHIHPEGLDNFIQTNGVGELSDSAKSNVCFTDEQISKLCEICEKTGNKANSSIFKILKYLKEHESVEITQSGKNTIEKTVCKENKKDGKHDLYDVKLIDRGVSLIPYKLLDDFIENKECGANNFPDTRVEYLKCDQISSLVCCKYDTYTDETIDGSLKLEIQPTDPSHAAFGGYTKTFVDRHIQASSEGGVAELFVLDGPPGTIDFLRNPKTLAEDHVNENAVKFFLEDKFPMDWYIKNLNVNDNSVFEEGTILIKVIHRVCLMYRASSEDEKKKIEWWPKTLREVMTLTSYNGVNFAESMPNLLLRRLVESGHQHCCVYPLLLGHFIKLEDCIQYLLAEDLHDWIKNRICTNDYKKYALGGGTQSTYFKIDENEVKRLATDKRFLSSLYELLKYKCLWYKEDANKVVEESYAKYLDVDDVVGYIEADDIKKKYVEGRTYGVSNLFDGYIRTLDIGVVKRIFNYNFEDCCDACKVLNKKNQFTHNNICLISCKNPKCKRCKYTAETLVKNKTKICLEEGINGNCFSCICDIDYFMMLSESRADKPLIMPYDDWGKYIVIKLSENLVRLSCELKKVSCKKETLAELLSSYMYTGAINKTNRLVKTNPLIKYVNADCLFLLKNMEIQSLKNDKGIANEWDSLTGSNRIDYILGGATPAQISRVSALEDLYYGNREDGKYYVKGKGSVSEREYFEYEKVETAMNMRKSNVGGGHISCFVDGRVKRKAKGGEEKKVTCKTCKKLDVMCGNCCQCKECCLKNQKKCIRCGFDLSDTGRICEKSNYYILPFLEDKDFDKCRVCFYDSSGTRISNIYNIEPYWVKKKDTVWETLKGNRDWKEKRPVIENHLIPLINDKDKSFINKLNEGQALLSGAASSIAGRIVKMDSDLELHEFCRLYKAAEMQRGLLAQKVPKVKSRKYDKGLEMYKERVKKCGKDKCQCVPYRVIDGSKNNNIKHLQDEDRLEYYKSLKHYSDCSTALKGSDVVSIEKHFDSYPRTPIIVLAPSGIGTISRFPNQLEIEKERDKCIKDIGGVCARDIFNKQLENFAFSGADVVELFSKTGADYNYKGIVDDVKEKFGRYSFLWNYSNVVIIKPGEGNPNWKFVLHGVSSDVVSCMGIPSVVSTIKNYIESAKISSIDSFHEELWKVLGKAFWTFSKEIFPEDKDFLLRRKYSELWSRSSAFLPGGDFEEFLFCNLKKAYQEHHGKMRDILESLRLYFYECVSAKNGPKTLTKIPKYSDFEYVYEDLINSGIVCDSFINLVPIEVLLKLLAKNNSPINLRLCCCLSSRKLEEMYKVLFRSDLPDKKEVIEKLATGQPNFTGSGFKKNEVATRWKSIVDTAAITDNDRKIITKNLLSIFNSGCEVSHKSMRHFIEKFVKGDTVAPQIKDVIERACREVSIGKDLSGKFVYHPNVPPDNIALWWKGMIDCSVGGALGPCIFFISYLNKMVENFVNNLNVSLVMNLLEGSEDEHKEALYPYIYRVLLSYINRRANEKSTLVVDLDKYKKFKTKDCRPEKVADTVANCKKGRKSHSYNASEVLKQENGRMGIFGGGKVMPYLNDGRIGNFEEGNRIKREIDRDKKNKESIENAIRIVNERDPNWLGSKGEKDEYIEKKQENCKNLDSLVKELNSLSFAVNKIGAGGADYAKKIVDIWVKILGESGITDYDYSDKSHKSFGKRVEYLSKLFRKCDDNIVDNVVDKVIDCARRKADNKVLIFMISNGFCGKRVHATKICNEIFKSGNFEELFAELVDGRISANIVKFFKRNVVLALCKYILDKKRWDYRNNKILEEKKSGELLKCANIVEVLNEIKKCNNQVEYYLTEKCLDGTTTPNKIKEIENFVNGLVVESVKGLNSKIDGCASFSVEEKTKIKDYYVGKNVFTEGFLRKLVDSNDVDGIVWLIINGILGEHDYKTLENLYKDKLKKILTDIVDNFFIWELKGQDEKKKRMLLTKISEWFKSLTEDQRNTVVKQLLVLEKSVSSSDKEKNEVLGEYVENFDYSAVVVNDTTKKKMLYELVLKKIIGSDANVDVSKNFSVKIVNLFVQQNEDNWDFLKHLYEEGSIENYTYLDYVLYLNNIFNNEIRENQYDFKDEDKKKYKVVKICLDGVVDKLVEDEKYHEDVFYPKSGTCTNDQINYFVYKMVKKYKESGDTKIKESIKGVFSKHINVDKFAKATTGTGDRIFSWGWLGFCPDGDLRCAEKDLNNNVENVNSTIWPAVADLIFKNCPPVLILSDPYKNVRSFYKSLMTYLSLGSLGNKDVQDFIWREVFISLDVDDTERPKLKEHVLGGVFEDDVLEQFFRCDQKFVFDMIGSKGFNKHFGQYIGLPDWIKYLYMFGSQNNLPLISLDGKTYKNTGSLSFFIDKCQEGDDIGRVNGIFGNKESSLFEFVESFYDSGIEVETVDSLEYYIEKIEKIEKIKVVDNHIEDFVNKSVYESMLKLLESYKRDEFENDHKTMNGDQKLLHEEQFKLMKNFILKHFKPSEYLKIFEKHEKLVKLKSFLDSIRKFLCNVSLGDFSGLMPGKKKDALSGGAFELFDKNLWIYYFIVNFDKSKDPYKSGIDLEKKINKLVCLNQQFCAPGPEMIPVCMNPVLVNKVGKLDGATILQLFNGTINIDTKLTGGGEIEFQYFDDKILEVLDEDSFSILFLGHLGKNVIKELFRAVAEKEGDVDSQPTSKVIDEISREFDKSIFYVKHAETYNLWKYKKFRDCVRGKYMNLFSFFYSSHPEVYNDNNLYELLKQCYNGSVDEGKALYLITPLLGKDRMMGTYEYLIMCKNNINGSNFDTEKVNKFNDDGSAFNFVKGELKKINLFNLQKLNTLAAKELGCDSNDLNSFLKKSPCNDNFVRKISEHLLKKRGSLREQFQALQLAAF